MVCEDAEIGALLLDKRADVSLIDYEGLTAAMHACITGNTDMLSLFINRGVGVFSHQPGQTGLMYACRHGRGDIVKLLLQAEGVTKGWVDHADRGSNTALSIAVEYNRADCVNALISFGANLNTVDLDGISVLFHAWKNLPILTMLLEAGAVDSQKEDAASALREACFEGKIDTAQLLIKFNADVNAADECGYAALMFAILGGENNIPLVRVLLNATPPAKVNLREKCKGRTALFDAASDYDSTDLARMLLEAGADPRIADADGCVAAMFARGNETAIELIRAAPDTLTHRNRRGRTVIHCFSACTDKICIGRDLRVYPARGR
jgi:ankyrin repeat protein